jgi:hypothetical protein
MSWNQKSEREDTKAQEVNAWSHPSEQVAMTARVGGSSAKKLFSTNEASMFMKTNR